MKKIKRVLALLGAILLIALYVSTLIFALLDSPLFFDLLKVSVAATIFFPVTLYACILFTRLGDHDEEE